uniref:Uncharacterized protein n=1 Tax=Oryza meridionalis TaxID=40149 RepID=A0A0E0DJN5_9ORYZ
MPGRPLRPAPSVAEARHHRVRPPRPTTGGHQPPPPATTLPSTIRRCRPSPVGRGHIAAQSPIPIFPSRRLAISRSLRPFLQIRAKSCSPSSAPPLGSRSYAASLQPSTAREDRPGAEVGRRGAHRRLARPSLPRAPTSRFRADCRYSSGLAEPKQEASTKVMKVMKASYEVVCNIKCRLAGLDLFPLMLFQFAAETHGTFLQQELLKSGSCDLS